MKQKREKVGVEYMANMLGHEAKEKKKREAEYMTHILGVGGGGEQSPNLKKIGHRFPCILDRIRKINPTQLTRTVVRDFPRPDLEQNIGPFPIQKMSKNFPNWCIYNVIPNFLFCKVTILCKFS